ncbi:MAG: hypothetical protein QOD72_3927 [Acidimicrobiaceae bacterium]|nr:hypothetical protein [Acidimicrobiaceae bacterium]
MALFRNRRITRTKAGTIKISLPESEIDLLRHLLPQLRELLTDGSDERLRRLFPTAYVDDIEAQAEFERLMHDDLVASRLAAITTVEESLGIDEITEDQLEAWMSSVNSVRLVLGTMLDASEELELDTIAEDDPNIEGYVLYGYLGYLLDEMVAVALG